MTKFEKIRIWAKEHTNELWIGGGSLLGAFVAGAFIGHLHKQERQETREQFYNLGQMHGYEIAELKGVTDYFEK